MTTRLEVHGADLSHHNPTPDLRKAKAAGLDWLIHKAVEGSTVTDSTYAARRKLAAEAGVPFGAYGFARPDGDGGDAKLEAMHLFKVAKPKAGDIVPALDFEVTFKGAEAWCKTWQAELKRLLATHGLTYGSALHYGPDDFGPDYKAARWVARYNSQNTPPEVPWDIFQFSNGKLGVPNHFAGLGNVDLNHVKPGFDFSKLILRPVKVPVEHKTFKLKAAHASLQYSDTAKQQAADCEVIFKRARERGIAWVTGTEAGETQLWERVQAAALKYGFRTHRMRGNWVAVDKEIIKRGSWKTGDVWIMDNDKVVGHGHDPAFPWVSFEHKTAGVGRISVCGIHYPTKGRTPKEPNFWVNEVYAKYIAKWAIEAGKGSDLVFIGGDFNMPVLDKRKGAPDIFFNQPFTTASEETGKFINTGHGPIDHIASYDKDGRVSATDWRVYGDKRIFLHTDHYYVEADFEARLLAA
jgi:GH25 family lysozyme M1 (1,4-beta-N-acetylmuramidase)